MTFGTAVFTGVGVTCIVFCIHLHRIRKQLAEACEKLREVTEELEEVIESASG